MKPSVVEYGRLIDIIGRPRIIGDLIFVAALVDFDEPISVVPEYRLTEHLQKRTIAPLVWPFPEGWPSLWVRARIPRLFGFSPPLCANNWQPLVNVAFLAIGHFFGEKHLRAFPFVCMEGFDPGDSLEEEPLVGLCFSSHGPDKETRQFIASCYWSLFLAEPKDLEPFADLSYNECTGYILVGFERNEFFIAELGEYDPDDGRLGEFNRHFAFFPEKLGWCPDCEGTGVEDWFPYTEDCATCGGMGTVSW